MVYVLEFALDLYFLAGTSESAVINIFSSRNRLWVKGRIIYSIEQLGTDVPGLTKARAIRCNMSSRDSLGRAMGPIDSLVDGCRVVAEQADEDDAFKSANLCENLVRVSNSVNNIAGVRKQFTVLNGFSKRILQLRMKMLRPRLCKA